MDRVNSRQLANRNC